MFEVSEVFTPGWIWTAVTLTALRDMDLVRERLGWDGLGAPRLDHWRPSIAKGRNVLFNLPKGHTVKLGDRFDLAGVADCFDLKSDWELLLPDSRLTV